MDSNCGSDSARVRERLMSVEALYEISRVGSDTRPINGTLIRRSCHKLTVRDVRRLKVTLLTAT